MVNVGCTSKYKEKLHFLWYFTRFALPFRFARRHFRSKIIKKNKFSLCIFLAYSYLCS